MQGFVGPAFNREISVLQPSQGRGDQSLDRGVLVVVVGDVVPEVPPEAFDGFNSGKYFGRITSRIPGCNATHSRTAWRVWKLALSQIKWTTWRCFSSWFSSPKCEMNGIPFGHFLLLRVLSCAESLM